MVDSLQNLKSVYEKWEGRGNEARLKSPDNQNANKVITEGKQRWKNKFGDSIRPPPVRRTREKRNFPKLKPMESVLSDSIAAFKTIPIVDAEAFRITRPFMGQCCDCLPTSKRSLMTGSCTQMGLRNVLDLDHELRNRGPLARYFSGLAYLLQRRIFYKYTGVTAAVLASGRVYDAIHQKTPNQQDITTDECSHKIEELKAVKKRAKRVEFILNNMQAHVSSILVSLTGWFLLKFLSLMTSSIQVHKGQMQLVKKATEKNVPMIYVPLHRSHLDYILVTFLLWNYDIKAPHIAAGENLNMPIFSYLMRGLGAFFIRRRLDKQRGKKDILYRSVLQSYIEELLRNGEGIEFFIEGGRSRTGKACYPKSGLLSVVVDAFRSDVIEDAYIVPVTISYEKLLDGNFNNELMGKRKAKETFWASMKGIWRVVRGDFGHVRVGFCQPFSLKEFMVTQSGRSFQDSSSVCSDSPSSPVNSDELSPDSPPEGFYSRRGSFSSLLGSEVVSSDQKETVDNLSQHIVYGAVNGTALMSTNLLAFLLLNKYRQGVSVITLMDSFAWLQDQLSDRKRDVGFSGSTEDVVSHALYLLGEELAVTSVDKNGNQIIEPNLSVPSVFELSYYGNSVISVFLLESVLVNSLLGVTDSANSQPDQPLSAHRERILDFAADICHLLRNEFIFTPTCEELRQKLAETLEDLVISELFQKEETKVQGAYTAAEQQWAKRFSESLEWQNEGSDSDDDVHPAHDHIIKVNLSDPEVSDRVMFLRGILGPLIEGYWITALTITKLREQEMAEEDFMKLLHSNALMRVEKDLVIYSESTSMEILRNAMKTYQEQKLINTYIAGNLKMVELRDNYQVEEQLHDLLDMLESLRE